MRDPDVCAAVRAAMRRLDPRRAIDLEAMAAHVTGERPNPRRTITVRPTGHAGAPVVAEPALDLLHGRVLRVLAAMDEPMRILTIGSCLGIGRNRLLAWLRHGKPDDPENGLRLSNRRAQQLVEHGHGRVRAALDATRETGT